MACHSEFHFNILFILSRHKNTFEVYCINLFPVIESHLFKIVIRKSENMKRKVA